MKPILSHHRSFVLIATALAVASFVNPALAFKSERIETLSAVAIMGGSAAADFEIRHTQLSGVSLITRDTIIQGEVLKAVAAPAVIPFSARRTIFSDPLPLNERKLRVYLKYRIVPRSFNPDDPPPTVKTLGPIDGSDPLLFAFQIPPNELVEGVLQYRIEAYDLSLQGTTLVEQAKKTLPQATDEIPEPWFEPSIVAQAQNQIGSQGGSVILRDGNPNDGQSSVEIPAGLFNGLTGVTLDELPINSPILPSINANGIRYYQATADRSFSGLAQVALLYPDFEFPAGANGLVDGTNTPVTSLGIYVWDGFSWRRLASMVDTRTNTIRARAPYFGFFMIAPAPNLTAEGRRPDEKIITPNGDGINDVALFAVNTLSENYKIEIFDITGRRIRSIMTGSSQTWDGRDDGGNIVESGVYIYQYEVDGKRTSGLIAVAK